ncbi:MAG: DUF120 domain-containing protein [Thermoplasmata archaeon]|nr:DUF120 domain-containing protein [Thermoplasmata archaeon]
MMGIVISGKGEGRKYVLLDGYKKQFKEKLGIEPFPGTLNLKVEKEVVNDLKKTNGIEIKGFSGDKEYGNVKAFPIKFKKEKAFLILPEKSNYEDVVEIIAEENLRDKYNLKDGDKVSFPFLPFIKKTKYKTYALPYIGKKEEEITIFYDSPFSKGRRDLCYFNEKKDTYRKTIVGFNTASILFDNNAKKAFLTLLDFIKENKYSIVSPPRKVKYSALKEWQIEVKVMEN